MSDNPQRRLEKQLFRQFRRTDARYELFAPGDRVMVAISGGKDSYVLLHLMGLYLPRLRFDVEFIAVHLDQQQPGYDGAPLRSWLEQSPYPFEILSEDTYSVVTDNIAPGGTYCSLCSRLRRGILYSAAERLGCNKIALGHHRDDTLETFMMNLFYTGKLQAMPAKYRTDDGRFEVIRPLMETGEDRIAELASMLEFPSIPCNLCGSQAGLRRDRMTELLTELERENPRLRSGMLSALQNVRGTHLLDNDVHSLVAEKNESSGLHAGLWTRTGGEPAMQAVDDSPAQGDSTQRSGGLRFGALPVQASESDDASIKLMTVASGIGKGRFVFGQSGRPGDVAESADVLDVELDHIAGEPLTVGEVGSDSRGVATELDAAVPDGRRHLRIFSS